MASAIPAPLKIVHLDCIHVRPTLTFTIPHTYTEYPNSLPDEIPSRIAGADVIITTRIPITSAALDSCPTLKMISIMAIGTDNLDLPACRERGIVVSNVPAASNESVAEHAIALYFAVKRNVVENHLKTTVGEGEEWVSKGTSIGFFANGMPRTCREDVMAIFGAGELGNRVAKIGAALGMKVIFAERKGVPAPSVRPGRTEFAEACKIATVIMITCPLDASSRNMISATEFALMHKDTVLINVARGGIVVEKDLIEALKENRIFGAATDVFEEEPAGMANSILIKAAREEWMRGRLILSPHVAWFARSSREKLNQTVASNIEAFARGAPENVVI